MRLDIGKRDGPRRGHFQGNNEHLGGLDWNWKHPEVKEVGRVEGTGNVWFQTQSKFPAAVKAENGRNLGDIVQVNSLMKFRRTSAELNATEPFAWSFHFV